MIVGAVALRSRLDAGTADRQDEANRVRGTLVCATELRAVCDQLRAANPSLDVRVEDAATTEATLTGSAFNAQTAKIDAWLVPQPFPAMVTEQRRASSLEPSLAEPTAVLARSPLVLAVWNDRLEALARSCPGGKPTDVTWACIGTVAGKPWTEVNGQGTWGSVKPGLPNPKTNATGLDVAAQATGQFLKRADFASNDFQDPDYQAWLGQLKGAVPASTTIATPLEQMLSVGKSTYDLAGSVEAAAADTGREKDRLTILYPSPMATADIVLVPVRGSESGERVKTLLETTGAPLLAQTGWRVDGQTPATGVRTDLALPNGNGLPKAGVMIALRAVWEGVAR